MKVASVNLRPENEQLATGSAEGDGARHVRLVHQRFRPRRAQPQKGRRREEAAAGTRVLTIMLVGVGETAPRDAS